MISVEKHLNQDKFWRIINLIIIGMANKPQNDFFLKQKFVNADFTVILFTGGQSQNAILYFAFVTFISSLFLSDPGVPGVRSMGPVVSHKLREVVQT